MTVSPLERDEMITEARERALKRLADATPVRYRSIHPPVETAAWREAMIAGEASNLVLVGPVGCGKTAAIWATLRALIADGWTTNRYRYPGDWKYYRATDLAAALRPDGDVEQTIDRARQVNLLVVDDLGSASLTTWQIEQLMRIFDYRWENARPSIVASNIPKLREILDDRLASRLQDEATIITLRGNDRRREHTQRMAPEWTNESERGAFARSVPTDWQV